jgi:hypothetical protein
MTLHDKLRTALIAYDQQESKKKYYNLYALGLYLEALQSATAHIAQGADVREVLCGHFNGRLLARLLKVAGVAPMTKEDNYGGIVRRTNYTR